MIAKASLNFLIIVIIAEVIAAFKFDFIQNFKSKISPSYTDSNTGYYKLVNSHEFHFNVSDIFGENNFNISKFAIVSILKFKYADKDELGINVFDLKASDFGEKRREIIFYIRREDNRISVSNSIDWKSSLGSFQVPETNLLADDKWHKIIVEYSDGIFKFWVDCEYAIEAKPEENTYEYIDFEKNQILEVELNPTRLFYKSANYELKVLELVTGNDIEKIKKNDCSDIPSSNTNFELDALVPLKDESKFYDQQNDIFAFKNYKELKEELKKFYSDHLQYNFDSSNFVVNFEIEFSSTSQLENSILDGKLHNVMYTANEEGQIRVYVDCSFVGNYTLYNIKKNLNFGSMHSVVDTIFELGLRHSMMKLKNLKIQSGKSTEENIKSFCPEHKGLESDSLRKCSELKKPFEKLNCEGRISENWQFNALETLKDFDNKLTTPQGDVFDYDGLTKFSGDLAENNANLFAPNFNSQDFSAVYILKIKEKGRKNRADEEKTIFDNNWHKMSSFRFDNFLYIYLDCELEYGFDVIENSGFISFDKHLNFIKATDSVTIIPFLGRFDGFDIQILNFTVYSPAKQIDSTDCTDIKELNTKKPESL